MKFNPDFPGSFRLCVQPMPLIRFDASRVSPGMFQLPTGSGSPVLEGGGKLPIPGAFVRNGDIEQYRHLTPGAFVRELVLLVRHRSVGVGLSSLLPALKFSFKTMVTQKPIMFFGILHHSGQVFWSRRHRYSKNDIR